MTKLLLAVVETAAILLLSIEMALAPAGPKLALAIFATGLIARTKIWRWVVVIIAAYLFELTPLTMGIDIDPLYAFFIVVAIFSLGAWSGLYVERRVVAAKETLLRWKEAMILEAINEHELTKEQIVSDLALALMKQRFPYVIRALDDLFTSLTIQRILERLLEQRKIAKRWCEPMIRGQSPTFHLYRRIK